MTDVEIPGKVLKTASVLVPVSFLACNSSIQISFYSFTTDIDTEPQWLPGTSEWDDIILQTGVDEEKLEDKIVCAVTKCITNGSCGQDGAWPPNTHTASAIVIAFALRLSNQTDWRAWVGGYWSESVWFDGTLRVNPATILLSHYNETAFKKTQRQQVAEHLLIRKDDRQQQISRRRSQSLNQSIDILRIYSSPPQITKGKLPHLVELPHCMCRELTGYWSEPLTQCEPGQVLSFCFKSQFLTCFLSFRTN